MSPRRPLPPPARRLLAGLLALLAVTARADDALARLQPALPPAAAVLRSLETHPAVEAAAYGVIASGAERRRLEAGPHEWTLRVLGQQRRSLPAGGAEQRFNEWNSALERPWRLPGKAAVDADLGAVGERAARAAAGDIRHETARDLLARWFDWLRELAAERQWAEQAATLGRQASVLARREQLGDAARIERLQAEAAEAQAEAQLAQARQRRLAAEAGLQRRHPALPLTPPQALPEPPPLAGNEDDWRHTLLDHSHELALATREAERAALIAERSRRDRIPDPSIGLQFGRERGGEERLAAAYVSIPLPGEARRAAADASQAQAAAAERQREQVRRRLDAEAASLLQGLREAAAHWQASRRAADRQQAAAAMSERAWQLGEGSLGDLLLARRLANEAALAARLAQLGALERHARLLLDAHRLWPDSPDTP